MGRAKAFTLVEILIVLVLLAVLAAIVIPSLASGKSREREAVLAKDIKLLRRFIAVYANQHLEVRPGYPDGDSKAAPTDVAFRNQATLSSNLKGETAPRGTLGYKYGPYLYKVPTNPFNELDTVQILGRGEAFPRAADGSHGWIYKPSTGEIRPDNVEAVGWGKAGYDN